MKKRLRIVWTIACLVLLSSFASAAPLSQVQIDAMGPDSAGNWVELSGAHTLKGSIDKSVGENFCIQVTSIGQYGKVYFYRDGNLIPSSYIQNYSHQLLTNSSGSVIGYRDAYKIPWNAIGVISVPVTVSQISVKETSASAGPTLEDYITNIKIQP